MMIKTFAFIFIYGFTSLPYAAYTPGEVRSWNEEKICDTTWSHVPRKIYESDKREVSRLYGIDYDTERGDFEYDHLIPRCIGGADTVANLFPLHRSGEWNAYDKNRLEIKACRMVCRGELDLKETQRAFATDWIALYKKIFGQKKSQPFWGWLFS